MRYNPFRPGNIVNPGMFSGRGAELITLEQVLSQTKHDNAHHFLIHGERGIGKSSLLLYLDWVARGLLTGTDDVSFRFLTSGFELEPSDTYTDVINKTGYSIGAAIERHERVKVLLKTVWDFVKRWEVLGIKYSSDNRIIQPNELLEDLANTISKISLNIKPEFDGMLILIDESDKPPASAHLGEFAKLLTEKLTKRGCNNVSLGLSGLSTIIHKLKQSHESSLRIFEILTLEPLLEEERISVIHKGLKEAREKNGFDVTITPEAESWISQFSEGYPHFIQQFAYSAFNADGDNNIDLDDVTRGAFGENGAFQQLGLKYFEDLYFDKIASDEYREVLRVMSSKLDGWVSKDEIRSATKFRNTTLNNAISALKRRNIILAQAGKKGMYRLPTKSFAVWIKAFTQGRTNPQ